MTKFSQDVHEIARKNERTILRAVATVTARHVCETSGISETQFSRLKEEKLEQYCTALAAMGLQVVSVDAAVVTKAERKFMAEQMIKHYQKIVDDEE